MQACLQNEVDSIAEGVRQKYESLLGLSKIVTEETISLSRLLGISEKKINKWVGEQKRGIISQT